MWKNETKEFDPDNLRGHGKLSERVVAKLLCVSQGQMLGSEQILLDLETSFISAQCISKEATVFRILYEDLLRFFDSPLSIFQKLEPVMVNQYKLIAENLNKILKIKIKEKRDRLNRKKEFILRNDERIQNTMSRLEKWRTGSESEIARVGQRVIFRWTHLLGSIRYPRWKNRGLSCVRARVEDLVTKSPRKSICNVSSSQKLFNLKVGVLENFRNLRRGL